ncbi:hypothetical protein PanWU01x14_328350 [Parasponia andersonii]|uniref:Uncharacterized protein n=1 Tax=Parasponia andersonii TaxID=3476 RepID=A0A2P5AIU7_PARAD|nr:hypothetical protein PanWU01x14_328350 [Parasponia andersonii]
MALGTFPRTLFASSVISFVCISIFAWITTPGLELVHELSFPWYILVPASTVIVAVVVHILFIIFLLENRRVVLPQAQCSWANNLFDNIVFFSVVANDIYDSRSFVYLVISSSTLIFILSLFSVVKSTKFCLLDLFISFINPKFFIYFFKKRMIGLLVATGILSAILIIIRNDDNGYLMCFVANANNSLKEIFTTISTKAKNLLDFLLSFMALIFAREAKDGESCHDVDVESADGVTVLEGAGNNGEAIGGGDLLPGGDGTLIVLHAMESSTDRLNFTGSPVNDIAGYGEAIAASQCQHDGSVSDGGYNREVIHVGGGLKSGHGTVTVLAHQPHSMESSTHDQLGITATHFGIAGYGEAISAADQYCQDGAVVAADPRYNGDAISGDGFKSVDGAERQDTVAAIAGPRYTEEAVSASSFKIGDGTECWDSVALIADSRYTGEAIAAGIFKSGDGTVTVLVNQLHDTVTSTGQQEAMVAAEGRDGVTDFADVVYNYKGEVISGVGPKIGDDTVKVLVNVLLATESATCGHGEAITIEECPVFANPHNNEDAISGGGPKCQDGTVTVLVNRLQAMESSTDQLNITATAGETPLNPPLTL